MGACSSQYLPSVSFGQPGAAHGRFAFLGIELIPIRQNRPEKERLAEKL
jgi:hypothetical protein